MKKKICFALALLLVIFLLAGCNQRERVLYDGDTMKITRTGAITTITDKDGGEVYTLHRVHQKRSEAKTEPYTAVDTPSMTITILPGGFRVESGNTTYTLVTHRRFTHG